MVADHMHGDCFAGAIVNHKDDAGVEGDDSAELVGHQCDGVVHVQRRADCLGDFVQRKHFTLSLGNGTEAQTAIRRAKNVRG